MFSCCVGVAFTAFGPLSFLCGLFIVLPYSPHPLFCFPPLFGGRWLCDNGKDKQIIVTGKFSLSGPDCLV